MAGEAKDPDDDAAGEGDISYQLRLVIQAGLSRAAVRRKAGGLDRVLSLECLEPSPPADDPTGESCDLLIDVLENHIFEDSSLEISLRRGLRVLFGAGGYATVSAPIRRENAARIFDPTIEELEQWMVSDTFLKYRERRYRSLVADMLEKYNKAWLLLPVPSRALPLSRRPPPNKTYDAVVEIRAGRRRLQRLDPEVGVDDLAIERWDHKVHVDRIGTGTYVIRATLLNTSQIEQLGIDLPLWYDGGRPVVDVKIGEYRTQVVPEEWKPGHGGFADIQFEEPLMPGKTITIECQVHFPDMFTAEEEWFEWYMARATTRFDLRIEFDRSWRISDVRASIPKSDGQTLSYTEPKASKHSISWSLRYPSRGWTYRLDWRMNHEHETAIGHAGMTLVVAIFV